MKKQRGGEQNMQPPYQPCDIKRIRQVCNISLTMYWISTEAPTFLLGYLGYQDIDILDWAHVIFSKILDRQRIFTE